MNKSALFNLKKGEISKVCRICFSQETVMNILNAQYGDIPMRDIFETIFHETIHSNDKGPISLCHRCSGLLLSFYSFIGQYEKTRPIIKQLCAANNGIHLDLAVESEIDIKDEPLEYAEEIEQIDIEAINEAIRKDHTYFATDKKKAAFERYKCGLCDFNAREVSSHPANCIANHYLRTHLLYTRGRRYQCVKCSLKFDILDEAHRHFHSKKHQNKQCSNCKQNFDTIKQHYQHVKNRKCQRNAVVDQKERKGVKLKINSHMVKQKLRRTKKYICYACQEDFDSFNDLLQHRKICYWYGKTLKHNMTSTPANGH